MKRDDNIKQTLVMHNNYVIIFKCFTARDTGFFWRIFFINLIFLVDFYVIYFHFFCVVFQIDIVVLVQTISILSHGCISE